MDSKLWLCDLEEDFFGQVEVSWQLKQEGKSAFYIEGPKGVEIVC